MRHARTLARRLASTFACAAPWPGPLHAHGVLEVRYAPPIPGWLLLLAGGLAVALSFAVVVRYRRAAPAGRRTRRLPRGAWSRVAAVAGATLGLGLAALVGISALVVDWRSETALAPLLVWIGWWMGLTWVVLLLGNLWSVLDPWNTLRRIYRRLIRRPCSLNLPVPGRLRLVPAIAALVIFAWFEMAWLGAREVGGVFGLLVAFSLWLWIGMLVFRPGEWWDNANPFARYFRILGTFGAAGPGRSSLEIRWPGAALHGARAESSAEAVFVVLILFFVSFDGFLATPEWWILLRRMMDVSYDIAPRVFAYHGAFLVALVAGAHLFVGGYFLICRWTARLARSGPGTGEVAAGFAFSLLPIAAAYHVAHFLPAVPGRLSRLLQGVADPFRRGWDLFGLSHFEWAVTWTPATAGYVWAAQTGLIVAGHAFGIAVAHAKAMSLYPDRRTAVRAGLPLTLLMIGYTMVSLWIISRPVLDKPLVPIPGLTP